LLTLRLGGETAFEEKCPLFAANKTTDLPLWQQTIAVKDVEVLEGDKWVVLLNLHNICFHFVAMSVDAQDTIYTFGGQHAFNAMCKLFLYFQQESGLQRSGCAYCDSNDFLRSVHMSRGISIEFAVVVIGVL
jgi:hypothetical protein